MVFAAPAAFTSRLSLSEVCVYRLNEKVRTDEALRWIGFSEDDAKRNASRGSGTY